MNDLFAFHTFNCAPRKIAQSIAATGSHFGQILRDNSEGIDIIWSILPFH